MKRTSLLNLPAEIEKNNYHLFYLVGEDSFLLEESRQQLYRHAENIGFSEKIHVQVDGATNWQDIYELCREPGLFSSQQLIFLSLPDILNKTIQNNLLELSQLIHDDIILVLQFTKLNQNILRQTWQQHLEKTIFGLQINCQTPTLEQLPQWLKQYCKQQNIAIEKEALQLLCYSYESNLLALAQLLAMLKLLYPEQKLTYRQVNESVEQSAFFTRYHWIDALLQGKLKRSLRVLKVLQKEDTQPLLLVRAAQRELITILRLVEGTERIEDSLKPLPTYQLREKFDHLKVWQSRRQILANTIQRWNYQKVFLLLQKLAEIDKNIKNSFDSNPWQQLDELTVTACS